MHVIKQSQKVLFSKLKKEIAIRDHEFGCLSICSFTDKGWESGREVFDTFLLPLVTAAERIYLKGYKPDWYKEIPAGYIPQWLGLFKKSVTKEGRDYYLANDKQTTENLFEFWLSPGTYVPIGNEIGKSYFIPGKPVIEITPDDIPVNGFIKISSFFAGVSNPWAAGYESIGKWIRGRYQSNSSYVYLPYRNLGSFRFYGASIAIATLVERTLGAGLNDIIGEHVPSYWFNDFTLEEGETIEQATERLKQYVY